MESEVARRRVNVIASHFASNDEISSATHLLPMNCSSSLNSAIPRYDNRMQFARQCSASQAFFMRPAAAPEQKTLQKPRNGTALAAPFFSRPTKEEPMLPKVEGCQPVGRDCIPSVLPGSPKFSRPSRCISGKIQFCNGKRLHSSQPNGTGWLPRMDVVESGRGYVLGIELPGVNVSDMRVEVSDQNLRVIGKRSNQYSVTNCSNYSASAYHKREICHGPFQVVWPIPSNVNKDNVSAVFMDGILRIAVPKL